MKTPLEVVQKEMEVNADVAAGSLAEWALGRGYMPQGVAEKLPRLAAQWHSEVVRAALAPKVVIEAISAAQLETLPEVASICVE